MHLLSEPLEDIVVYSDSDTYFSLWSFDCWTPFPYKRFTFQIGLLLQIPVEESDRFSPGDETSARIVPGVSTVHEPVTAGDKIGQEDHMP